MARKNKKIKIILNRAEKLFNAGNFLMAEKEFEKIQKRLNSDDITEKLEVCRRQTREIKGKELVKQPHKAASNNNLKAWEAAHDDTLLLKCALNLVKCEKYGEALVHFQKMTLKDDNAFYQYGFSLAKTGHPYAALKQWERIDCLDKDFTQQVCHLVFLACADLYQHLGKFGEQETLHIHDCCTTAKDLLEYARRFDLEPLAILLENLSSYFNLVLVEVLWKKQDFSAVAAILPDLNIMDDPAILALYAKTYFHLAPGKERFLEPMMTYWLTVVYSREISASFSDSEEQRAKVQNQLIHIAENEINRHHTSESGHSAATILAVERKLLQDLFAISQKQDHDSMPGSMLVCTPQYAVLSGVLDKILDMIKGNRAYFKDTEHYLETGGYYSRAWQSLYALKINDFKKALTLAQELDPTLPVDEFTDYVLGLVHFKCGLAAVENRHKDKKKDVLNYFALTPRLFASVPSIEQRFVERVLQSSGDWDIDYEKILYFLHTQQGSDAIADALCIVKVRNALKRYNSDQIHIRQLKNLIEKATNFSPENEFAIHTLEEVSVDFEIEEIAGAIGKNKLGKSARLARGSKHPKVRDRFFEFMEDLCQQVQNSGVDVFTHKVYLYDFMNAAMTVDPDHTVVSSIKEKIERL
ncbi:MAG: hypothetical protein RBR67_07515 [Desulfobacterium sp.]|nr:hypothetical protein [Desulfobacterium sp.]